ncbi:MAG: hypothetical protein WCF36_15365 [Candidatus Nanopelagicales bacterium]
MFDKLIRVPSAQARWRAVNSPHLVALVEAGEVFEKGKIRRTTRRHSRADRK